MSQARLRRGPRVLSRIKYYDFGPGRMERLHLAVWTVPKAEGLLKAKLTGQAYVACGAGNEHYPEVELEYFGHPKNAGSADLIAAVNGDEEAATRIAEKMEEFALEDWFDPCEAEELE
jgi:hypothetical protein